MRAKTATFLTWHNRDTFTLNTHFRESRLHFTSKWITFCEFQRLIRSNSGTFDCEYCQHFTKNDERKIIFCFSSCSTICGRVKSCFWIFSKISCWNFHNDFYNSLTHSFVILQQSILNCLWKEKRKRNCCEFELSWLYS